MVPERLTVSHQLVCVEVPLIQCCLEVVEDHGDVFSAGLDHPLLSGVRAVFDMLADPTYAVSVTSERLKMKHMVWSLDLSASSSMRTSVLGREKR